ncbi:MAG: DUF1552 domain-containing protein [Gemmataceae bacterium]
MKEWIGSREAARKISNLTKVLDVLEPLRNEVTIYSGLSHPAARQVHGHSNADQYLTGAPIGGSGPYQNSISIDQVYAEHAGEFTRHASLVMSTNGGVGGPRGAQTQSFNREGRPIPAMNKPKEIFDMLFVTSGKDAAARLARSKSALDLLIENTRSLSRELSSKDQETLKQYLDAVRDTELKLTKAQKWIDTPVPKVDSRNLHLNAEPKEAKLYFQTMYELIYLAFLSDSTRVATFQLGRENGEGLIDLLSLAVGLGGAHGLTHEVKKTQRMEKPRHLQPIPSSGIRPLHSEVERNQGADRQRQHAGQHVRHARARVQQFPLVPQLPDHLGGGKNLGFTNGRYLKFGKATRTIRPERHRQWTSVGRQSGR